MSDNRTHAPLPKMPSYLLDEVEDNCEVQNYKHHGRYIAALLQDAGASLAWLESLRRLDQGDDMPMPVKCSPFGFEDGILYLRESGILARIRWLIESHANDTCRSQRHQMIKAEVERDLSNNERGAVEPDRQLGEHRRGQLKTFGERQGKDKTAEREREWEKWRLEAARLCILRPELLENKTKLARQIKKNLGLDVVLRTITRRLP
jgi:hypothetical protein